MVFGKTLSLGWRIIVFAVTFAVVVWVLVNLKFWGSDLNTYFLRTGKWGELLFVILLVFIVTQVFEKLLRWEFRLQARGEKGRR